MDRKILIQGLINNRKYSNYLEIGTFKGDTFLAIKCKKKIAVDPSFQIPLRKKIDWLVKNPTNIHNKYFEMISDKFFGNKRKIIKNLKNLDIVLIDGLHTFHASLKDVLNSLKHLDQSGIIIMHDCFPPHKAAAIATRTYLEAEKSKPDGWTGEWCGDVWKTVVYLRKKYTDVLNVEVINADYGLGIIEIKPSKLFSKEIDKSLFDAVNSLDYNDLLNDTKNLIGLRDFDQNNL